MNPTKNNTISKYNNENGGFSININTNLPTTVPRTIDANVHTNSIYRFYQQKVNTAAMNQKIFTIHGHYPSIRNELIKRGWLEKCTANRFRNLQKLSIFSLLTNARNGNEYEVIALSKLMENVHVKFYWLPKNGTCKSQQYFLPYINIIRRNGQLDFTTKDGLIGCIENSHWNIIDGISEIKVPRYHRLRYNTEHIEFLEDYRTTYCLSLLQYIREIESIDELFHQCGTIPIKVVDFALTKIENELANRNIDDIINENCKLKKRISDINMEWMTFYYNVDHLVNGQDKLTSLNNNKDMINYVTQSKNIMKEADKYWPQIQSDGYNNLWIIKPASSCRGWGITIKNNFENILGYVGKRHKIKYIVQKYIERPLLIYNTKFDIRQYILLTITESRFNIWMYKDCYLRFSSQEYQLTNLKESVHITNNAVQRKYKNGIRSSELPAHNMWTHQQFQLYLNETGNHGIWQKKIYPGMKKNIIAIVLTSLEETGIYPNLFELYGCDFMLNEKFEPILIEINGTPDMTNSTIVTAKICPAVLADLIKVVIDLPKNRKANIGQFELAHSSVYTPVNKVNNTELEVIGTRYKTSQQSSNKSKKLR